jgi:acyl carrier protein
LNFKWFELLNFIQNERKKDMLERIKEIIEEQLNIEGVEITEETRFKEDLEADSLDLFEMVMAFEEEYGVEIPSEDLEKITTVGSIIEYLKDKGVEE